MMGTIHRFVGSEEPFDWENVPEKMMDQRDAVGVTGKVLVGPGDGAPNFCIRYLTWSTSQETNSTSLRPPEMSRWASCAWSRRHRMLIRRDGRPRKHSAGAHHMCAGGGPIRLT